MSREKILLNLIKLRSIFKKKLAYVDKYSTKEHELLVLKK